MSQDERNFTEKRDFLRMRLNSNATLVFNDNEFPAVCRDLSSSGMQLETECALALGDRVLVHIASGLDSFEDLQAEAEVVRVNELTAGTRLVGVSVIRMI